MTKNIKKIYDSLEVIPNFPQPGISFKDITPIFANPKILNLTINELIKLIPIAKVKFDYVAGLESRGFLVGLPIAQKLKLPFIPIRKKGKLPRQTVSAFYTSEYGKAEIEIHKNDIKPRTNVLLVDDIIATGGTILAAHTLINNLQANCQHVLVLGWLAKEVPGTLAKLQKKGMNIHFLFEL